MDKRIPTTEWTCLHCGAQASRKPTRGQRPKFCSKRCRSAHGKDCERCGTVRVRSDARWCGDCSEVVKPLPKPATMIQCSWCHALHMGSGKFCSTECRRGRFASTRRPLRIAYEAGDHAAVIEVIKARVTEQDGCWIYPNVGRDGYGHINIAGKDILVHRMMLEAKHGQSLGSQAAHHICATASCVNPDHLQPVTHRDNVAEMLARQSYLSRIRDLEAALSECRPDHPLLQVIDVA